MRIYPNARIFPNQQLRVLKTTADHRRARHRYREQQQSAVVNRIDHHRQQSASSSESQPAIEVFTECKTEIKEEPEEPTVTSDFERPVLSPLRPYRPLVVKVRNSGRRRTGVRGIHVSTNHQPAPTNNFSSTSATQTDCVETLEPLPPLPTCVDVSCETCPDESLQNAMPAHLENYSPNFPDSHEFSADCKEAIVNVYEYLKARCVAEPEKETARACEIELEQLQQILLEIPQQFEAKNGARRFAEPEISVKKMSFDECCPKAFQCNECDFAARSVSKLYKHIDIVHKGINIPFLCDLCGKGFRTKEGYWRHINRHEGLKPFKCSTCPRQFVDRNSLVLHKNQHIGARPFACKYCGKSFTQSGSKRRHEVVAHTGNYKFKCKSCKKQFLYQFELKKHMNAECDPYYE